MANELVDVLNEMVAIERTVVGIVPVKNAEAWPLMSIPQVSLPMFVHDWRPSAVSFQAMALQEVAWEIDAILVYQPSEANRTPAIVFQNAATFIKPTLAAFAAHLKLNNVTQGPTMIHHVVPPSIMNLGGTNFVVVVFQFTARDKFSLTVGV